MISMLGAYIFPVILLTLVTVIHLNYNCLFAIIQLLKRGRRVQHDHGE